MFFKKIRYESGKREIYFGKKKIFSYVNQTKLADFLERTIKENINSHFYALHDVNRLNASRGGGILFFHLPIK